MSARSWSAPVPWRFGWKGEVVVVGGGAARRLGAKAVGDYRTPRRFATGPAWGCPPGRGVRQSPGALGGKGKWWWLGGGAVRRLGAKAVEDYRTPRRFATGPAWGCPPGRGVRQSPGALGGKRKRWWVGGSGAQVGRESGRGLPHSKTLRDGPGVGMSARSWSAPVPWRFGWKGEVVVVGGGAVRRLGAKAVEDYRTPRRFATGPAWGCPPGRGVRQSPGSREPIPRGQPTLQRRPRWRRTRP
jgi:hypothetical protein